MNKKVDDISWYHGKLSREDAEDLLKQESEKNGLFLVRDSISSIGDYVLSVIHNKEINHYQIRRHVEDAFFSIDERIKFHGLDVLIEYYQSTPNVLCEGLILTEYVKGSQPPHDSRLLGRTNLLHRATLGGSLEVVSALLKTDKPPDVKDQEGRTAAHLASMKGYDHILERLIQCDANVNLRDSAGYTPLHYASQNNFPSTVKLLIQKGGANVQARHTDSGRVPLHEAAERGHIDIVKELISLSAPTRPRNKDDATPAQLARMNNHIECAEILENYKHRVTRAEKTKWYQGTLGRQEAETMIKEYATKNGTFLVRFSERNKENVLTLYYDEDFYHYIINTNKDGFLYIDDGPYLDSLEHIVEHYSMMQDGLPTVLQYPVPPKPKPPVPEFSTMPRPKRKNKVVQGDPSNSHDYVPKCYPSQSQDTPFTCDIIASNNNNYNEKDDRYIPLERLTRGALIGEGEFASVYEGTYLKNNGQVIKVAIKTLHPEQMQSSKGEFLREAEVMMKLDHHCVVKLIGLSEGPPLLMVQELLPLGSMLQYITTNSDRINPNYEFKIWAAQIAYGMQYLEKNELVHRDLAARNILLASKNQAKISDFGLSRAFGQGHQYYQAKEGGKWPLKWYAPESYNYGQFSNKSDVWSFGVTIWEMYTFGQTPYGDLKGSEAIKLIEEGERLKQPESCPDHIYDIMKRCWEYKAAGRPSFQELVDIFTTDSGYMNIKDLVVEVNLV
nr:unnamed protein product [Callosobruchus analis]